MRLESDSFCQNKKYFLIGFFFGKELKKEIVLVEQVCNGFVAVG